RVPELSFGVGVLLADIDLRVEVPGREWLAVPDLAGARLVDESSRGILDPKAIGPDVELVIAPQIKIIAEALLRPHVVEQQIDCGVVRRGINQQHADLSVPAIRFACERDTLLVVRTLARRAFAVKSGGAFHAESKQLHV